MYAQDAAEPDSATRRSGEDELIREAAKISADTWFRLSHWAAATGNSSHGSEAWHIHSASGHPRARHPRSSKRPKACGRWRKHYASALNKMHLSSDRGRNQASLLVVRPTLLSAPQKSAAEVTGRVPAG